LWAVELSQDLSPSSVLSKGPEEFFASKEKSEKPAHALSQLGFVVGVAGSKDSSSP
jgi:hypothetical protein